MLSMSQFNGWNKFKLTDLKCKYLFSHLIPLVVILNIKAQLKVTTIDSNLWSNISATHRRNENEKEKKIVFRLLIKCVFFFFLIRRLSTFIHLRCFCMHLHLKQTKRWCTYAPHTHKQQAWNNNNKRKCVRRNKTKNKSILFMFSSAKTALQRTGNCIFRRNTTMKTLSDEFSFMNFYSYGA